MRLTQSFAQGQYVSPRPIGFGSPYPHFARTFDQTSLIMENAIKHLRIQNFKSIEDVTLKPRRVNIIIGEPNVGKSNILEAMSLLGGIVYEQTEKFMGSFIRYEEPRQLFYDNLVANTIKVETDLYVAILFYNGKDKQFEYLLCDSALYLADIRNTMAGNEAFAVMYDLPRLANEISKVSLSDPELTFLRLSLDKQGTSRQGDKQAEAAWELIPIAERLPKSYTFLKNAPINEDSASRHLLPPSGSNLIEVIQTRPELRKEAGKLFARYGQKLQLRADERRLEVIKDLEITTAYPYSSIADTLQRLIFYLAAIESNDDAVLLFEEPEAHSFPVHVSKLGRHIVESRNNQFFIVTHSDYLVTEILEKMLTDDELTGELAFFAAYYEDHQTKVHQLSDQEIFDIRADGLDVFYNMKRFTTNRADA